MIIYLLICLVFFILFLFAIDWKEMRERRQIGVLGSIAICTFVAFFWWVFLIIIFALLLSLPDPE